MAWHIYYIYFTPAFLLRYQCPGALPSWGAFFIGIDALVIATAQTTPATGITTPAPLFSCQIVTNFFQDAGPTVFSDPLLSF